VSAGACYEVLSPAGRLKQAKRVLMVIKASCRCKATTFEVFCTCSFCSKRGSLWAYYSPAQFKLTSPAENVTVYEWGSKTVKHGFCAVCGCGTFTETPDWSTGEPDFDNPKISVNSRLFDDSDLDQIEVVVIDGKNLW
jgi:hypothetical protein